MLIQQLWTSAKEVKLFEFGGESDPVIPLGAQVVFGQS